VKGIGGRVQRLQYIELLWVGSQWLTFRANKGRTISCRTRSLIRLLEAIQLKILKTYLQESSKGVMRRRYEPRSIIHYLGEDLSSAQVQVTSQSSGAPGLRLYLSTLMPEGGRYI
jgi:hypothetical protein